MKTLIISLLVATLSIPAFAAAPSAELVQVTRALLNSPQIIAQLNKNYSAHLDDVKITTVKAGVTQFDLVFNRTCFCMPSTASVRILEDLTPTYADGSPIYTSTVVIKPGI